MLVALLAPNAPLGPARAQEPGDEPAQGEPPALTREELTAFFDRVFTSAVVEEPVPGAAVSVVVGGRGTFRAYGIDEAGRTRDVTARGTVFAAREVSQVVTAIAALRLVDAGALDLDADVGRWLGDEVLPEAEEGAAPLTLAHLLSHTAGLQGSPAATLADSEVAVEPLDAFLAARPLRRTRPPGELVVPTDEAAALVGLLVEEASGVPFAQYVREEVLVPLGMGRTDFGPPDSGDLATGHEVTDDGYQRAPYGFFHTAPAQSLVANTSDMTALLRLLLSEGADAEGRPVLSPDTAALLLRRHDGNHPGLPGVSLGLFEHRENGQRAWSRVGTGLGFSSVLLVVPDHDVGFYAVYNSDHRDVRDDLVTAFFDEFFPDDPEAAVPRSLPADDLERYVGGYAPDHDATTVLRARARLVDQATISTSDDGTLRFDGAAWRPVTAPRGGPGAAAAGSADAVRPGALFQSVDDPDRLLAFGEDADGDVVFLFPEHDVDEERDATWSRQPWSRTPEGLRTLGGAFAVAFLVVLVAAVVQRRRSEGAHPGLRRCVQVIAATNLGFLVVLPLGLVLLGGPLRVESGVPLGFLVVLGVPVLTLVLSVCLALGAGVARARGRLTTAGLVAPLLVAALGAAFAAVTARWEVFGPFGLTAYL